MKKDKIIEKFNIISLSLWAISIFLGALYGEYNSSTIMGAFGGFIIGVGIVILNAFIVRIIDDPSKLFFFLIFLAIGFLIGLIWGINGAIIGTLISGVIAFLFVADMLK